MVSGKNLNNVVDKSSTDPDYKGKLYGDLSLTENAKLMWEPLTFQAYGKISRTTNRSLATQIREYLAKTFHDIRGVNISYVPGRKDPFNVEIFFAQNGMPLKPDDHKIKNVVDTTFAGNKNSLYYRKKALDNRIMGKHYTINDETKLLLADFCYGGKKANLPNNNKWKRFIEEVWVPTSDWTFNPRASECLIKVSGCFDLKRFLKRLYGNNMVTKTEVYKENNKEKYRNYSSAAEYFPRFIEYMKNEPTVFIINIEQFDPEAVEKFILNENPFQRAMSGGIIYY